MAKTSNELKDLNNILKKNFEDSDKITGVFNSKLSSLLDLIQQEKKDRRREYIRQQKERDSRKATNKGKKELETMLSKGSPKENFAAAKRKKEEDKKQAEEEANRTKFSDIAMSKYESGDFIGGLIHEFLGRKEPKKEELEKEREKKEEARLEKEEQLWYTKLDELKKTITNVQVTVTPQPTSNVPQEQIAQTENIDKQKETVDVTPQLTSNVPQEQIAQTENIDKQKETVDVTPQLTSNVPQEQIAQTENIHNQKETVDVARQQIVSVKVLNDDMNKLWAGPIVVNVDDFSNKSLIHLVTKLKDEGIGTGGGGGIINDLVEGLAIRKVMQYASKFLPKLGSMAKGIGAAGLYGIAGEALSMGGHALKSSGNTKSGSVMHGVGTLGKIAAGATMGATIGGIPTFGIGIIPGAVIGGLLSVALDASDVAETLQDISKLITVIKDFVIKDFFKKKDKNNSFGLTPQQLESIAGQFKTEETQKAVQQYVASESGGKSDIINKIGAAGSYQFTQDTAMDQATALARMSIHPEILDTLKGKQKINFSKDKELEKLVDPNEISKYIKQKYPESLAVAVANLSPEQQAAMAQNFFAPLLKLKPDADFADFKAYGFSPSKTRQVLSGTTTGSETKISTQGTDSWTQNPQFAKWDSNNDGELTFDELHAALKSSTPKIYKPTPPEIGEGMPPFISSRVPPKIGVNILGAKELQAERPVMAINYAPSNQTNINGGSGGSGNYASASQQIRSPHPDGFQQYFGRSDG